MLVLVFGIDLLQAARELVAEPKQIRINNDLVKMGRATFAANAVVMLLFVWLQTQSNAIYMNTCFAAVALLAGIDIIFQLQ